MKRILVPIDFSAQSVNAFRFALDIAGRSNGTITLLHVTTLPALHDSALLPAAGFKKALIRELSEVAESKFKRIINKYNTENIRIHTNVITGRVHTGIIQFIQKENFDLVVMGTKGSSGLKEWMVGSNTEKMVRTSPVPVIAIKTYTPGMSIKRIIFPNSLDTENQEDLIMKIKGLQNFFQAKLYVIWVNTPALSKPDHEIRRQLQRFADRFMLKDYTINVFNYTNEESGILEFTTQTKGDMIAMGTHGLTGLAHLLAGSVAEDVVNHVLFPVWTYSAKSAKALTTR